LAEPTIAAQPILQTLVAGDWADSFGLCMVDHDALHLTRIHLGQQIRPAPAGRWLIGFIPHADVGIKDRHTRFEME